MIISLVKLLIAPPVCLLLLAVAGAIVARWRKRAGVAMVAVAVGGLWLLSTPVVAALLLAPLQPEALELEREAQRSDPERPAAIVVLGADTSPYAPELGGESIGPLGVERARYAARLHHATGLPILCTGGVGHRTRATHASLMSAFLKEELGCEVRWLEGRSRTTRENAELSAPLLAEDGVDAIYLVSHAWHLARAVPEFESHGLRVVPAPTAFREPPRLGLGDLIPSAKGLQDSSRAWHEWIGRLWYAF